MISSLIPLWCKLLIGNKLHLRILNISIIISYLVLSQFHIANGEIVDRILAVVNGEIISLSDINRYISLHPDLKERFQTVRGGLFSEEKTGKLNREILDMMIDERLLILEAKRLEIEVESNPNPFLYNKLLIEKFINQRIRSFIFIFPREIEKYYNENHDRFKGLELEEVYKKINEILIEKKTSQRLDKYLRKLRSTANIKINLSN
ncbi:MAG: SurA N-terminal domain-containing protein [Nitrospirota bacterium]